MPSFQGIVDQPNLATPRNEKMKTKTSSMRSTLRSRTVQTPIALSSSWRSSVQSLFHHRSRRLFVVASEWRSLPLSWGRTSTEKNERENDPRDDDKKETTRRRDAFSTRSHHRLIFTKSFRFFFVSFFSHVPKTRKSEAYY